MNDEWTPVDHYPLHDAVGAEVWARLIVALLALLLVSAL